MANAVDKAGRQETHRRRRGRNMTNSKRALGRLLGGASVAALSMAVLLPAGAFAQEATATNQAGAAPAAPAADPAALQPQVSGGPANPTQLGAIVVTGSRIARKDYTSNSPIVTMNSQALSNQS